MIRVVIYESSSFGGCYDYSLQLLKWYALDPDVSNCVLLLPKTVGAKGNGIDTILIGDKVRVKNKFLRKMHFLYRNLINPFILFFFLLFQKKSLVILNDFEQLTAPVYAPFFSFFLKKHTFAVFLHDPDRDNYPPSPEISSFCMKKLMSFAELGLYHDYLPAKNYYKNSHTSYIAVPHGIYPATEPDSALYEKIKAWKKERFLFSILGNIRPEKNYKLAIQSLTKVSGSCLLIAGNPSNSSVDTANLKQLAEEIGIADRVLWIEKFLSDEEMAATIQVADCILLYYASSFTSQSGILNLIAPWGKRIIVSDLQSSLTACCRKFNLGKIAEPDNLDLLSNAMMEVKNSDSVTEWEPYVAYASWEKQVNLVLDHYKKLNYV